MSKRVLALLGVYVCECACVWKLCAVCCVVSCMLILSRGYRKGGGDVHRMKKSLCGEGGAARVCVRGMAAHTAY